MYAPPAALPCAIALLLFSVVHRTPAAFAKGCQQSLPYGQTTICSPPSHTCPFQPPPASLWGQLEPVTVMHNATYYDGTIRPDNSAKLWTGIDIESNTMAVSWFGGLLVYDLTNPTAPIPRGSISGWSGQLPVWLPDLTEIMQVFYAVDIPAGDSTFASLGGMQGFALLIVDLANTGSPVVRYLDDLSTQLNHSLWGAKIGARSYTYAVGAGSTVYLYDLTAARPLTACRETIGCPGVRRAVLTHSASYLSGIQVAGKTYLVTSNAFNSPTNVHIYDATSSPTAPSLRATGYTGRPVYGTALWTHLGRTYLAARLDTSVEITDVTPCLTASGCSSFPSPLGAYSIRSVPESSIYRPLQASSSGATPFLFVGNFDLCHEGDEPGGHEYILNVADPTRPVDVSPRQLLPFFSSGGLRDLDYWGWYASDTKWGWANISPRGGLFKGPYLYRAAYALGDIHRWVEPDVPPTASFTWSPTTPSLIYPGDVVQFTDTSAGAVSSRTWTFQGGSPPAASSQPATTTWAAHGNKNVSLRVENAAGSDTETATVPITNPAPNIAAVTINPNPALIGDQVAFAAGVTGKPPLSFSWAISGISQPLSGPTPTWPTTGQAPGAKTITLTLSNSIGSVSTQRTLTLVDGAIRQFAPVCPESICIFNSPAVVTFAVSTGGIITQYEWDWDGNGQYEQTTAFPVTTHLYIGAGSFLPRLRVTSSTGSTSTAVTDRSITILPTQNGSLTIFGPTNAESSTPTPYTAHATGCTPNPSGYTWSSAGSSVSSTTAATSITWSSAGLKTLAVANNACGSGLGVLFVTVTPPLLDEGFESGTLSPWSHHQP